MKRVSFKVAKAIKKSGYPQDDLSVWYDDYGVIFTIRPKEGTEYYVAPTYLEAWLWLWREKKIVIDVEHLLASNTWWDGGISGGEFTDPEEVIIAAIEYLCENDLIK